MEYDDIEAIVNSVARIALEGIVERSYTQAERERLEHAALTGEWRPIPPLGALGHADGQGSRHRGLIRGVRATPEPVLARTGCL